MILRASGIYDGNKNLNGGLVTVDLMSVSYTHLDVYKRQELENSLQVALFGKLYLE